MSTPAESIAILDFGSQYTQLIARRIRELGVFCEIFPFTRSEGLEAYAGIVLSGGPQSVYGEHAPRIDAGLFALGRPVLGICYGMQLLVHLLGGEVQGGFPGTYGRSSIEVSAFDGVFAGLGGQEREPVWMSHGDRVVSLPEGFSRTAETERGVLAAIADPARRLFGLQFHPEVAHTPRGRKILGNFVHGVCGVEGGWTMEGFVTESVAQIREQVGAEHVILGLSGGVDSSVLAALVHRAIGDQLHCIHVDNGLLRENETEEIEAAFEKTLGALTVVRAGPRFLGKLEGVTDPERKRKAIGHEFIAVFEEQARRFENAAWLAQGTLYPDVIESVSVKGPSAVIKSHHNVGGLPEKMGLKLLEPLRHLFKDEVRALGAELGLPHALLWRHPFPGPGLAIRVLGAVEESRLKTLRHADRILLEELRENHLYDEIWQAFAVLLPVRTVGVMGDERTYQNALALRCVTSVDGMTADWARVPAEVLAVISSRIINEVPGVNRVVYDISSKPPGTIEWE